MACPYFCPSAPRAALVSQQNAMLPLGDSFAGDCRATPDLPFHPDATVSRQYCNLGYARGECAHFPAGDGPDAVRFTISSHLGETLRLYYVLERNHHPFAHGPLEYSLPSATFASEPVSPFLALQARAYIASYLRRKAEAGRP